METKYKKVRVKGLDLVGTLAFPGGDTPYEYYGTAAEGSGTKVIAVYFEETGEVRQFNDSFIEVLEDPA